MGLNPTGEQYSIFCEGYRLCVTEVGATLRSLSYGDRELLWTFPASGLPQACQGMQLLPWPSRIEDGRYVFAGQAQQLALTEPDRRVALHGLNFGQRWELVNHSETEVTQRTSFFPQPGWPGLLTVELTHQVGPEGMLVSFTATNDGDAPLPFGYGAHPYFAFEELSQVNLEVPFEKELVLDSERLLPVRIEPIPAARNYQTPKPIGNTEFDNAFTCPKEQPWRVKLQASTHAIEIWAQDPLSWVQVYTPPGRRAIAVEPMTCGANAFNPGPTHDDLIVLAPQESFSAAWGVRVLN